MAFLNNSGIVDSNNSTAAALGSGGVFTGTATDVSRYSSVVFSCKSDVAGTLTAQFSTDGTNWDSVLTYIVIAGQNEAHRLTVSKKFFRIVYTNGAAAQSYLRLQTILGNASALSSPLNLVLQQDADAITVRNLDFEWQVQQGLLSGYSTVPKLGRNGNVSANNIPQDIWAGGGIYTGFPVGAAETFEVFSDNAADTGVLTFTYLPSFTATEWLTASVTLNGTTPVNTGISGVRMHTAQYASGTATGLNAGIITIRHITTTANVFCRMPVGRSQTQVCAYTVPFGNTAILKSIEVTVTGSNTGQIAGSIWVRTNNLSPRYRRQFAAATNAPHYDAPFGGLILPALTDVKPQITFASAQNLEVTVAMNILLIKTV